MTSPTYNLIIKSPNDKIPCQNVTCLKGWSIKHLKEYLSINHPSKPSLTSQRLIHAGKLLKDDVLISSLFSQSGESQTVHLVCPSAKSITNQKEKETSVSPFKISDIPPEELQQYQQAYYHYLQDFYLQNSSMMQSQQLPSNCTWQNFGGATWPPFAYQGSPYSFSSVQFQQNSAGVENNGTVLNSNVAVSDRMSWRQRAYSFLSNWRSANVGEAQQPVAAEQLNQDELADRPLPEHADHQGAQQVMMLDNGMANGILRDEIDDGAGHVDIVDQFYMLFRLCLFVGLCFAYSSLDKAVIVFSVAAYVYLYNVYRRYAALANVVQQQQQQQRPQEQQPIQDNNTQSVSSDSASTSSNHTGNEQELHQRVQQPSTAETGSDVLMASEPETPRRSRVTNNLRSVASVSYNFFSSLITSIIPEQPPPIRFD